MMDRDHAPDPRLAQHDSQADEFMGLPVRVWPDAPPHAIVIVIGHDIGRGDGTRDVIAAARQLGKTQTAMHLAAARKPPKPLGFSVPVLAIGTLLAACALAAILITILEHLNR